MRIIGIAASVCSCLVLAACTAGAAAGGEQAAVSTPPPASMSVPAAGAEFVSGADKEAMIAQLRKGSYLPREAVPSSLLLNPAPPAPGSAAMARDEEASRAGLALMGTPRWEQARIDANLFTPAITGTFSCAAGFRISPETTPKLQALLLKSMMDFGLSTYPTKNKYQRGRPFMENGKPICTPDQEEVLRKDGSYPSGHSAIGYGMGLILAEVVPDRAAQLVARGRAFGDSRRICNVHWLSDIEEGRVVASAVAARLNADPAFETDLAAARAEVAASRASLPVPDCAREDAALGG
ncbi:acid phosphatase [Novosphingobium album (ex Hu et al. 2023)]|uniref:Phosphatase PAP2 family protein n=1 Tax=Novosphingobium album (ex Hu et al. 2023) TaxID=2930093 RepID=A0ABT0AZ14_9SPHN|nr:phosphatase PAP2 family protein [Novosphingobium album (ex Hu et al. 2023)]MCJ2177885.1 phosphatase PAP2 family protein [Novosphingobium album (ex Hu et al. 2023)]